MTEAEAELSRRIGLRLRAARQARRFSLVELAARTNGHYSKSRISNYEQGLRRLSVEGAECLAEALGNVNAAYLLCVNEDEATNFTQDELLLLDLFRETDVVSKRFLLICAEAVKRCTPPPPEVDRGAAGESGLRA